MVDASSSSIAKSSSKLAPAQNAFSPSLFTRIAFTSFLAPSSKIVSANFSRIAPGRALLFAVPKVISAILFLISDVTKSLIFSLYSIYTKVLNKGLLRKLMS